MNLFQSKNYKTMVTLLQQSGFYLQTMKNFNYQSVATNIKDYRSCEAFLEVVSSSKLSAFTLTKVVLILLCLTQSDPSLQQVPSLQNFIAKLQAKSQRIVKRAYKPEKNLVRSFSPSVLLTKVENMFSGKSHQCYSSESSLRNDNSVSYLINHLLHPLLGIVSKINANYDEVYRPNQEMNDDLCWATLNLLKKYLQLSKSFEEIGRYYQQCYSEVMLGVITVMDYDVRTLYKRVVQYLKVIIARVQKDIMDKKLKKLTEHEEEQIKHILLLVGEIDSLNDDIRLMYVGKYFAKMFYNNGIRIPTLFRGQQIVDFFDQIFRKHRRQENKKKRKCSSASADTDFSCDDRFTTMDVNKLIVEAFGEQSKIEKKGEENEPIFTSQKLLF